MAFPNEGVHFYRAKTVTSHSRIQGIMREKEVKINEKIKLSKRKGERARERGRRDLNSC